MKRKIILSEIIKEVASGMTDSELMKKHNLSRDQLLSLFRRLDEIREKRIQMLVGDLRSRMDPLELMKKYQLSAEGLEKVVKWLLEAKVINREELHNFDSSPDSWQTRSSEGPDDSEFPEIYRPSHSPFESPSWVPGTAVAQSPSSDESDGDFGISPRDYITIIMRRGWVFLTVFVACLLVTAAYTFTCTPVFRSAATIEFEEKRPKQEDRVYGYLDYGQYKGYLATQQEILKSRGLAESLVAKMNLAESPEFSAKGSWLGSWFPAFLSWPFGSNDKEKAADAPSERVNALSAAVLRRVSVNSVKTSNLVAVTMDATSPEFANQMLRNYLDIYLQENLAKRRKESLEVSAWLKEELTKVEKKLMESQAKLVSFQIDNGILDSSTPAGVNPMLDLLVKTMDTQAKSRDARLRMQALEKQKVSELGVVLPKDVNNEYLSKLKVELGLVESEHSQMKAVYSQNYPKMLILNQKMKFLRERISEIEKSVVDSALETAKDEESLFKGAVDLARDESNRMRAFGAQHTLLKKQVENNENFQQMLLKEAGENEIKSRTVNNNISIIDPPSKPDSPRWPPQGLLLLMGSLIGLVGGIAAAFVVEHLDNTVRTPEEIERDFRVRRLAIVPDLDSHRKLHEKRLVATSYEFIAYEHPKSPMSDAVKNIQTSIFLSSSHRPLSCMVVSSAVPNEGKTLIAISLATVLCSSKKKAVIVDGDLRNPRVHKIFGHRDPGPGLSTFLEGKSDRLSNILRTHTIDGLFYITSGPIVSDHLPLIQSENMKKLVDELRRTFDYIVFDSPPILGFSDVPILCTYGDGLILVAKEGHVSRDELREAINETSSMNGRGILGVVLNKVRAPGAPHGYDSRYRFRYGNH